MLLTHRDPALFPDPLAFRPERIIDTRVDPYRWFSFGGGTRRCLGLSLALFEMRVVLATSLRSAELRTNLRGPDRVRRRGLLLAPAGRGRATVMPV